MLKNLCKNYEEEFNPQENNLDYVLKNVQAFISYKYSILYENYKFIVYFLNEK